MKVIAALDLGTAEFKAIIAEEIEYGRFRILGHDKEKAQGVKAGIVLNVHTAAEAVARLMNRVSEKANKKVRTVHVSVSGEHIRMIRHRNFVTIMSDTREISTEDLVRLEEDAKRVRIPEDGMILHVLPEDYKVEGVPGCSTPLIFRGSVERKELIGIMADRIEATNLIVYAAKRAVQNIATCVEQAGYQISEYILQPLATANAVLQENEKDIGVMMIDIGAGTTDIAVIHRGSIGYSRLIGVAGDQITEDLRNSLRVVTEDAERIKKEYGYARSSAVVKDEDIRVEGVGAWGSELIPASAVAQFISASMTGLLQQIEHEVKNQRLHEKFSAGIILTGGTALLRGLPEVLKDLLGSPTRVGFPLRSIVDGNPIVEKPEYSTVVGLLFGAPGKETISAEVPEEQKPDLASVETTERKAQGSFWQKVKKAFNDLRINNEIMNRAN